MTSNMLCPRLVNAVVREVLLLELSIELGTLLQFSASAFRAIRTSLLEDPASVPKQGLVITLKDVLLLSELLHEVHLVAAPIAQGRYADAAAAATSIAQGVSEVAGLNGIEPLLDQPYGYEQRQVQAMLRRRGHVLSPSMPEGIEAFIRLAKTCKQLEETYVHA